MSWTIVARKDFEDAARSRLLWGILGVFVALIALVVFAISASTGDGSAEQFLAFFGVLGGEFVVPVVALVAGYMAIVGERQSGSILVLFGLPHSRRDILAGKLVGRGAVIVVATLLAFAVGAVLSVVLFGSLPVGTFVAFTLLTTLLGLAFVSLAVGVSASVRSRGRAMAGAIGGYFLFMVLWEPVVAAVHYLVEGDLAGLQAPAWYFLLERFSPVFAYIQAANSLFDAAPITPLVQWPVENVPQEAYSQPNALDLSNRVAGDLPFYLSDWFAVAVMLAWLVVPAALGYLRFRSSDLA